MQKYLATILVTFLTLNVYSQTSDSKPDTYVKKNVVAKKTDQSIAIDGKLDEDVWQNAEIATDFVMLEPDNGVPLNESKKAEVKILYDNEAIYIGAFLKMIHH